ncbi:MAG: UvrD-helicase domain-containing protein [Candidatus Absconditabacteria bacterium]
MSKIQEYIKGKLNQQQFEASIYCDSSSLILAGAGSGKTRTLTYKIAYMIFEKNIHPSNILAVTFTNKAANEMKERIIEIYNQLSGENMKDDEVEDDFDKLIASATSSSAQRKAINPHVDLKWMGTFHSTFLKILKIDIEELGLGYTKNFGIYDPSESMSVLKDVMKKLNLIDKIDIKEAKNKISWLKNEGKTYERFLQTLDESEELVGKIYEKYQKTLQESNAVDFDDLLLLPKILFEKKPEILEKWQNQFQYILVDEAQDTNQLQFDIIRLLSGKNGNVTFIGDDYQSIYMWRGAVMDNFLNISNRWKDCKIFKLEVNYRSRPHIVNAGNSIILKNSKQYDKTVTAHRSGNDTIRVFAFSDQTDEALNIVNMIIKIKEDKNFKRGDLAILYRTNAQSQPFEQVLVTEGIPYIIWGGFKFFERQEIKHMMSYIKYLMNPKDSVSLKKIINIPNRKIGQTSIERVDEYSTAHGISMNEVISNIDKLPIKLTPMSVNNIKQFNTIIRFIENQLETLTPDKIIENIVNNIKYKDYVISQEGKDKAEERMENIGQLINLATKYTNTGKQGLQELLDEITLMTDIEQDDGSKDAVKLMSVHSSKGLEFPVVFISGLEENIFPLPKAKFDNNELEEERRLMYVAITRAKDILFMSYANSRLQWGQRKYNAPSRFIEEIPDEYMKTYDISGGSKSNKNSTINTNITEGTLVFHKLFGNGKVVEIWNDVAIVKFDNPKYGMKRLDIRFLSAI